MSTARARVLVVALALVSTHLVAPRAVGASSAPCNGSARLCAMPLGDVAFATTHNSMASTADGFIPPNQDTAVDEQLEHGIRGFQIDVYAGYPRKGSVYTELEGRFGEQATDLPTTFVGQATRIHRALGAPPAGTPTRVYLCHTFCELGAVRMSTVMRQMRGFLDEHERVVLVMVMEDYVAPERIRQVLDNSGLGSMLLAVEPGDTLPTLGEMIDSGKRVLVSLENGDGGPTLPNTFSGLVEETPFSFLHARLISARRARATRTAAWAGHRSCSSTTGSRPPTDGLRPGERPTAEGARRAVRRGTRPAADAGRGRLRRTRGPPRRGA